MKFDDDSGEAPSALEARWTSLRRETPPAALKARVLEVLARERRGEAARRVFGIAAAILATAVLATFGPSPSRGFDAEDAGGSRRSFIDDLSARLADAPRAPRAIARLDRELFDPAFLADPLREGRRHTFEGGR